MKWLVIQTRLCDYEIFNPLFEVVETPDKEHFKTVWVHEGSQLAKNLENQFKKQGRRYYLEWR